MGENKPVTFRMNSTLFAIYVVTLIVIGLASINTELFWFVVAISSVILVFMTLMYIFSSVTVSDIGVDYRSGWLNITRKHIPFDKINTVDVVVSLAGRALDYGKIRIFTGNDVESISFNAIDHPNELKSLIEEQINKDDQEQNSSDDDENCADEIAKLDKLRDDGVLTNDEFEAKKKQLLGL